MASLSFKTEITNDNKELILLAILYFRLKKARKIDLFSLPTYSLYEHASEVASLIYKKHQPKGTSMDKSTTGKGHPQGDMAAIEKLLAVVEKIKPGITPREQVVLLREIVECAKRWCPISKLGTKKIDEHFDRRDRRLFQEDSLVSHRYGQIRAIELIAPTGDSHSMLGYYDDFQDRRPTKAVLISLFLCENCSILALQAHSSTRGGDIQLSHKVEVLLAEDDFLVDLIKRKHGFEGNKHLIVNALEALCLTMHDAQGEVQKRANLIGAAGTAMSIIGKAFGKTMVA